MRIALLVFLLWLPTLSESQTPAGDTPVRISLCEIKAHPAAYLHKLVEFTAVASHGFEDSMVDDKACPWPKGPGVWMEFGGKHSTDTMYCCGFSPSNQRPEPLVIDGLTLPLVDDEEFRTFDQRLHPKHPPKRSSDLVRATLRGRIFARYEGIMGTQQSPEWRGYGHMDCCMLFVVQQVTSVDPNRVKQ